MTDRIIVSRKALEDVLCERLHPTSSLDAKAAGMIREIIDTAEEAESAWITDRPPTKEEVGNVEWCNVTIKHADSIRVDGWTGRETRDWWHTTDSEAAIAWQPLPAPYVPPVKRLCWCGAEMKTRALSPGLWIVTCSQYGTAHGAGPAATEASTAEIAYDKMVGR